MNTRKNRGDTGAREGYLQAVPASYKTPAMQLIQLRRVGNHSAPTNTCNMKKTSVPYKHVGLKTNQA